MKRELLAATALTTTLGMLAGAAQAQEYDWTGFYAGLGLNGVFGGEAAYDYSLDDGSFSGFASSGAFGAAFAGGTLTFGYNAQSGSFVFGAETDKTLGIGRTTVIDNGFDDFVTTTQDLNLFTLRGRAGVTFDRLMLYGTGGLAAGRSTITATSNIDSGKFTSSGQATDTVLGFVAGGGVEFAATDNARFKFETLYFDLADQEVVATGADTFSATANNRGILVRTGINIPIN